MPIPLFSRFKRGCNIHGSTEVLVYTLRVSTITSPQTAATRWITDPDSVPFIGALNFGQEGDTNQYIPLLTSTHYPTWILSQRLMPTRMCLRGTRQIIMSSDDIHPEKYGTYWRGPYKNVTPMVYGPHDKVLYTIRSHHE